MLQKAKFITKLSKSTTNKSASVGVETPIQFLKGVGPKLGAIFQKRQIYTVKDLLYFFPRSYEDRSQVFQISQLSDGVHATLSVFVISQRKIPIQRLGRSILEVRCRDQSGEINLKWFYPPRGIEERFVQDVRLVVTGKVKFYQGRPEILHPEVHLGVSSGNQESQPHLGRIVPIYTELEGVPNRVFRKVLWEALQKYADSLEEDLPAYLLEQRRLPSLSFSIKAIHFPPESPEFSLSDLDQFQTIAHHRLIYDKFFKFEYLMLRNKIYSEKASSYCLGSLEALEKLKDLMKELPFELTVGQKEALRDILNDFVRGEPMNRLVQGDVGAGKTAVAFLSAGLVLAEKKQVAMMAPTEILAEQHFKNLINLFKNKITPALLTGKTSNSERNQIQQRLSSGEPMLLIGTHALIEESVCFSNLAYVIVDEQHRFGVEQRRALRQKGAQFNSVKNQLIFPHSLILTATPIPRTLALTAFGDLDVTSIRDLPPGRSPIKTRVIRTRAQRDQVYRLITQEIEAGRQVYFIFPLITDSEAEGFIQLKSALSESQRLAVEVFPQFSVGLLHGQMSSDQKSQVMDHFKSGKIDVLVSTTVIEVGVDVANATVMVIEHAERFGLSQLHQLRGRVGRGKNQSYCFLCSESKGDSLSARLDVLEQTSDGFQIAEADLEIRGPGEFLGTRQAGSVYFQLGNLVRDQDFLLQAREDAIRILKEDPNLDQSQHISIKKYYEREGLLQFSRLNTS